jgi:uncharacterized protein YukE
MAEEFRGEPPELRAVSARLEDVASRMEEVMSALRAELAGVGTPWGQFSEGPNGVSAQLASVESALDAKTKLLKSYTAKLKHAADAFESQDTV